MRKSFISVIMALMLGGCSMVQGPLVGFVKDDVDRAKEIADKYSDTIASKCYSYLSNVLASSPANEEVSGLISAAELARVLRNVVSKNEAAFKTECGQLAGEVVLDIARRVRQ